MWEFWLENRQHKVLLHKSLHRKKSTQVKKQSTCYWVWIICDKLMMVENEMVGRISTVQNRITQPALKFIRKVLMSSKKIQRPFSFFIWITVHTPVFIFLAHFLKVKKTFFQEVFFRKFCLYRPVHLHQNFEISSLENLVQRTGFFCLFQIRFLLPV